MLARYYTFVFESACDEDCNQLVTDSQSSTLMLRKNNSSPWSVQCRRVGLMCADSTVSMRPAFRSLHFVYNLNSICVCLCMHRACLCVRMCDVRLLVCLFVCLLVCLCLCVCMSVRIDESVSWCSRACFIVYPCIATRLPACERI